MQVSPSLGQLALRDSPDDDAAELDLLPRLAIGGAPGVADHDLVSLGDDVLDGQVNVGESLENCRQLLFGAFWARH